MSGGQFWGLIFTVLSVLPAVYVIAYRVVLGALTAATLGAMNPAKTDKTK